MERSVAVVGGGVGGLAAAVGFVRDGWRVVVHERAASPAVDGTALGIWPDALAALDRIGLGAALRERSTRETGGTLRRPDGAVLARIDVDRIQRRHGDGVRLVARPDLVELLTAALPGGVLRRGCVVDDVRALQAEHDLVVGADGIRSIARAALLGTSDRDARLRPTGTVAFRGVAEVRVDAGTETWGRAARFGVIPHGAGRARANWYATLPLADVRAAGDDLALLAERFGTWHAPVPAVLARIAEDGHLRHELADVAPRLSRYTDGRSLALVGDAAHAMTPDLGQGACQALIDGVALAEAVREHGVPAGLAAYDRARRRPTQRTVALARLVHRLAGARRGTRVRDALLRAAPI